MASRVNLGMGGFKKKSPAKKKSSIKRKTNGQGVKMKSKGGAMGKKMAPDYNMGGAAEKDKNKKAMKKTPKGMKKGGKMARKGVKVGGKI
tara:strand:+ start:351 stop:620 length:270 start_codon:yes stop_codon:yes gene_type:complete